MRFRRLRKDDELGWILSRPQLNDVRGDLFVDDDGHVCFLTLADIAYMKPILSGREHIAYDTKAEIMDKNDERVIAAVIAWMDHRAEHPNDVNGSMLAALKAARK